MGNKLSLFILLSLCLLCSFAVAQDKAPDPGIPDTVTAASVQVPLGTTEVVIPVTLYNDENLGGFGLPFRWNSPDIVCDSISFVGSRVSYVNTKPVEIDTAGQKLQVGMIILFESYLSPGEGLIFNLHFSIADGAAAQTIQFDSTSYNAASPFILSTATGATFVPQYIPGVLQIGEPAQDPTIGLDPTELNFSGTAGGTNPVSQSFGVSNTGDGTLNWTASTATSWISLDPTSGTDAGTVTVSVDITGLAAGEHVGTISVADPAATNTPQTVTVNLHLDPPPPCLSLSAAEFNFSGIEGAVQSQTLTITNCGGQTLNWTISGVDAAWLTPDPSSGSTTSSQDVDLIVNFAGLAPGDYSDEITVAGAAGTENTPQTVTINVHVIDTTPEADTVWVGTTSTGAGTQAVVNINYQNFVNIGGVADFPLQFSGDDLVCDSVSFVGSRLEPFSLRPYTIDNDAQTILIGIIPLESEGDIPPGNGLFARLYFSVAPEAATQSVVIDTITFIPPAGSYHFLDENGAVRPTEFFTGGINITGLPCFEFPVTSVSFTGEVGSTIASQNFTATNGCYGTLNVTSVTDDATWLTVSSTSPYVFSVNTAGLGVGTHNATVTFVSNAINSPVDIPVSLTLYAVPALSVSPTSFNFGTVCQGSIVNGSFNITNTGTGTLEWTATSHSAVALSDESGTAPSLVSFDLNTGELGFGPQTVTATITSAGAEGSPVTVSMTVNVANCDECTFDIAEVDGMQGFPVAVPVYAYQVSNIAGLEFHMEFDGSMLEIDSVASDYLSDPTVGLLDPPVNQIHYIWDNLGNPVSVPDGEPIIVLWFTAIGEIDDEAAITWMDGNEIVDPFGEPLLGIGYCNGMVTIVNPVFDIHGKITYYDKTNRYVEGVTVTLTGPDNDMMYTDAMGAYVFGDVHVGSYIITPTRDDDDSGVSVSDIVLIRRHLAYIDQFDNPYKMVAADVNLSDNVSVADVVVIQRYLADLDPLPSGNWTFIVWDHGINMTNWFNAPRFISLNVTSHDVFMQDFYAIRLGDVNASWSPTPGFAKVATAQHKEVAVKFGDAEYDNQFVTVPVSLSDIDDLAALELHIAFNPGQVHVVGIDSDILKGAMTNTRDGVAHIVWEDINAPLNLNGSETLANITFAVDDPETAGDITISGVELANSAGEVFTVDATAKGSFNGSGAQPSLYSLSQNEPNPFNPTTTIKATMAVAGQYELAIYNVMGQRIRTYQGYSEAGQIQFTWDGNDDNGARVSSGIYLYKFQADTFSDTKKMVLLK
ncbi:MAG: cohesin domain-containing protein [Candidatus Zixiibacteriota bacterium]